MNDGRLVGSMVGISVVIDVEVVSVVLVVGSFVDEYKIVSVVFDVG